MFGPQQESSTEHEAAGSKHRRDASEPTHQDGSGTLKRYRASGDDMNLDPPHPGDGQSPIQADPTIDLGLVDTEREPTEPVSRSTDDLMNGTDDFLEPADLSMVPNTQEGQRGSAPLEGVLEQLRLDEEEHEDEDEPIPSDNNPEIDTENIDAENTDVEAENGHLPPVLHIRELKNVQAFIDLLKSATLDSSKLHPDVLERLRNPPTEPIEITDDIRLSLELYLGFDRASDKHYNLVRRVLARPPHNIEMLSLDQVKRKALEISGVYPLYQDMCFKSCAGFTGPWAELDKCPLCGEARYDQHKLETKNIHVGRKQFLTVPVGPMLQAFHRSVQSATAMHYRAKCVTRAWQEFEGQGINVKVFTDWIDGSDHWKAFLRGDLQGNKNIVLMFSIDGAQLYRMKQSGCWIYIWVLLDMAPDTRYKDKHILVGGVIPGPNKPKNIESFVFPGFHHVAGLMKEGLPIWDAELARKHIADLFLAFLCADGPGMADVNGLVGHSGAQGCRLYCGMQGRLKPGTGIYYPVCLRPEEPYNIPASAHADIEIGARPPSQENIIASYKRNLHHIQESPNVTQYRARRLATGIAKPTIVSGLPQDCVFSIPGCFPPDIMHLAGLNIPDLLVNLWRGTISCSVGDDKDTWDWAVFRNHDMWKAHGALVGGCVKYLPGSFDRPPRNIQEKLTSGYKCVEFETWLYGYCPGLLYGVLPMKYWEHLCKLVRGIRLASQRSITLEQLVQGHKMLCEYVRDFELLYYQRKPSRLHFVRPCLHMLPHLFPETSRIGPLRLESQYAMERTIGSLGAEIRQPSKPYANLARRAHRRCMANVIKAMAPDLDPPDTLPAGAFDIGGGYVLLRASEDYEHALPIKESQTLITFLRNFPEPVCTSDGFLARPKVAKWARLRLPNGQIARSLWKEHTNTPRTARNVKIIRNGEEHFAEVQYYFKLVLIPNLLPRTFAMVSLYSLPHANLLNRSSNVLWSCRYQGDNALEIIDVHSIQAVVAMIPHPSVDDPILTAALKGRVFVVEKLGLNVLALTEDVENAEEE